MIRFVPSFSLRVVPRAPTRASSALLRVSAAFPYLPTMAKRKRSTVAVPSESSTPGLPQIPHTPVPLPANVTGLQTKPPRRQQLRGRSSAATNPNINPDVLDGVTALRASPDSGGDEEGAPVVKPRVH